MKRYIFLFFVLTSVVAASAQQATPFIVPIAKGYFDTTRLFHKEGCCPYSVEIANNAPAPNKTSIRFTLNDTDSLFSSGMRAEIAFKPEPVLKVERWYSFDVFIPTDYPDDATPEIIAQWHERPDFELGEDWRSPPISLRHQNGNCFLNLLWSAAPVNTNLTALSRKFELGKIKKGVWTNWIFQIKFSWEADGILNLWQDGKKVLSYKGPNCYNDRRGNYFKLGIYKPGWKDRLSITTRAVHKRILYFSNIKLSDSVIKYK